MSTKKTLWIVGGVIGSGMLAVFVCVVGLVIVVIASPSPLGKCVKLNGGSQLYYTPEVTKDEADKLAKFLNDDFIKPGNPQFTSQLTKVNGVYQVRMCIQDGKVKEAELPFMALGILVSHKVFEKSPLEVHLCDDKMKTLKTIPIRSTETASVER